MNCLSSWDHFQGGTAFVEIFLPPVRKRALGGGLGMLVPSYLGMWDLVSLISTSTLGGGGGGGGGVYSLMSPLDILGRILEGF